MTSPPGFRLGVRKAHLHVPRWLRLARASRGRVVGRGDTCQCERAPGSRRGTHTCAQGGGLVAKIPGKVDLPPPSPIAPYSPGHGAALGSLVSRAALAHGTLLEHNQLSYCTLLSTKVPMAAALALRVVAFGAP